MWFSSPRTSIPRTLTIALLICSICSNASAHGTDIPPEPEDLPSEALLECVEGMAGKYPCQNMAMTGFVPISEFGGHETNDIWGWTDRESGTEYAIVGTQGGVAFFELSSGGEPDWLGTLPATAGLSDWRDMKVYRDHVFVVSEAKLHGMQIFDLTRLRESNDSPVTYTIDARYSRFGNAHNIVINEETGFAYAVGTNTCSGGLHMIDIADPLAPSFAGCFATDGYTHDAQCVVYRGPDLRYFEREICFNLNEDSLTIADVTDKSLPLMLSRAQYDSPQYTHQGWLSEDHRYILFGDELDERNLRIKTRTFVFDLSDLESPRLTGVHLAATDAIDHNQYIDGNHVYQANYRAGIRVLRLGDLASAEMVEVAYFDTSPVDDNAIFLGTWSVYPYFESGLIVASDIRKGLFVLRPNLLALPQCSDGIDNDGDGLRDYPEDPACDDPTHPDEGIRTDIEIAFGTHFSPTRIKDGCRGVVHLGLLVSETVDVMDIDIESLRLGTGGASPSDQNVRVHSSCPISFPVDAFGNEGEVRVVKFRLAELELTSTDREICVEGRIGADRFISCYSLVEDFGLEPEVGAAGPDSSASTLGANPLEAVATPSVPSLGPLALGVLALQLARALRERVSRRGV